MKVIKKPIAVEAEKATKDGIIKTLEGNMKYKKGDYIITGVNGERYPVAKDIFLKTYDILDDYF